MRRFCVKMMPIVYLPWHNYALSGKLCATWSAGTICGRAGTPMSSYGMSSGAVAVASPTAHQGSKKNSMVKRRGQMVHEMAWNGMKLDTKWYESHGSTMLPRMFPHNQYLSIFIVYIFHYFSWFIRESISSINNSMAFPRSPMRSFTRSSRSNSSSPARSGRRGRTAATEKMKQEDEWALGWTKRCCNVG